METRIDSRINIIKIGFYSSLLLVCFTIVTFGLAMTAIPNSGAFCPGDCFHYPYFDTLSEYPQDYLWMYPAILLLLIFLVFVIAIHSHASENYKIYSRIAMNFSVISALILIVTYFVQFTVVPASLLSRETDGIALLTQYNPHGIFIALEELGYLLMSLVFVFLLPAFPGQNRLEKSIRWIYFSSFILAVLSFIFITIKFGSNREDRFEIVIISINWFTLVINGVLTSVFFKRQQKK